MEVFNDSKTRKQLVLQWQLSADTCRNHNDRIRNTRPDSLESIFVGNSAKQKKPRSIEILEEDLEELLRLIDED